jgi:hypothetical protein
MANPHRGEKSVTIGDKTFTLVFTTNTICEVEDALDKGILEIQQQFGRLSVLRSLLWAGLREKHPEITLKAAGDLLGTAGAKVLGPVILEAIIAAFPKREADENAGPENPQ